MEEFITFDQEKMSELEYNAKLWKKNSLLVFKWQH